MYFRISVHETSTPLRPEVASIIGEGPNWFGALVEGLTALEQPLTMQNLSFSILDDGVSAVLREREGGRCFEIIAVDRQPRDRPSTPIPKTLCCDSTTPPPRTTSDEPGIQSTPPPVDPDATSKMSPIPEDPDYVATMAEPGSEADRPSVAAPQRQSISEVESDSVGRYFMSLAELDQQFSTDRVGAAHRLLQYASGASGSAGGGILFYDAENQSPMLQFVAALGPARELLLGRSVPLGQGPVGVCANLGVSLNIKNLAQEVRFDGGVLTQLGLDVGPMLCIPLLHDEWLQGVIMLYKTREQPDFTQGERVSLERVASTFGSYLQLS